MKQSKQYWLSIMNHPKTCGCDGCQTLQASEKDQFGYPVNMVDTPSNGPDHLTYNADRLAFDLAWNLPPVYGPALPPDRMYVVRYDGDGTRFLTTERFEITEPEVQL